MDLRQRGTDSEPGSAKVSSRVARQLWNMWKIISADSISQNPFLCNVSLALPVLARTGFWRTRLLPSTTIPSESSAPSQAGTTPSEVGSNLPLPLQWRIVPTRVPASRRSLTVCSLYPDALAPIIAALFSGNAIVLKASENVAWSSHIYVDAIRACLRACGENEELVQIVTCWPDVVESLTGDPRIKHITFVSLSNVENTIVTRSPTR